MLLTEQSMLLFGFFVGVLAIGYNVVESESSEGVGISVINISLVTP